MDFTIKIYKELLQSLKSAGFSFLSFSDYLSYSSDGISSEPTKTIILRHDVDLLPKHSLRFAQIQHSLGIKGSYYFRAVPESWNEEVIKEIANLGHEVGYHYENMDVANATSNIQNPKHEVKDSEKKYSAPETLIDSAYENFTFNLEKLRQLTEVKTICMHGSPRAKFDNKAIWEKYDYKKLGLLGEPYYDMNFDDYFYLTDTGRRWDGWKVSVRDKVSQQEEWIKKGLIFQSTHNIIHAANNNKLPDNIMFTFHPQRWNTNLYLWTKELILQNAKNQVKRFIVKR